MRITDAEKDVLVSSVRQADHNARIWLFGSRLDDSKKGGDIDIAVLSPLIHIPSGCAYDVVLLTALGSKKLTWLFPLTEPILFFEWQLKQEYA